MPRVPRTYCLVVVFFLAAIGATPAAGQDVQAGLDLLQTEPALTEFDFGPTPIPADFFGPGSDPFDGIIALSGGPLPSLCPNDNMIGIDTIVERLADAQLPLIGDDDLIPIEIIELSLVSSSPITVTYNGGLNPEQWDVEVDLSQDPQPTGQMTIHRTHANGGTFDTDLPVLPRFTFTRLTEVRVLDFGVEVIPPVLLQGAGDPWEDKLPVPGSCTSNWCPTPGGPLVLTAPNAAHGAYPLCPTVGAVGDVHAGLDLLQTDAALTEFDFAPTPVPADFFGPGSDPFDGIIALAGGPLSTGLCPNDDLSGIDTIVERLADAHVPVIGNNDVIPIEIIELSLVSSSPITVTYNGGLNPEQWDVEVDLSQDPQPTGQMTIHRTHANGGTFDTQLPVLPRFTFTRLTEVRILDSGLEGIPPVGLEGAGDPWEDKLPVPGSCTSNWCPTPGGPLVLAAPNAVHGAYPLCPTVTAVGDAVPALEAQLKAYPNPFNPSVVITFSVPVSSHFDVLVYDVSGRRVAKLFAGSVVAGDRRTLTWRPGDESGRSVSSGIYFVRLVGDGVAVTRKIVLLK